jgi:hypothetical protein
VTVLRNEKTMRRRATKLVIAFAVLVPGLAMSSVASAQEEGSRLGAPIEGTWILTVHRVNQDVTFTAFQSFTAGGVTVATGTIDRTPPPPISPLYGSWRKVGHNSYVATLCFFFFDDAGKALGMIKNFETFRMEDENNLTGSGPAVVCDPSGENCVPFNDTITITGKRLIAQGSSD